MNQIYILQSKDTKKILTASTNISKLKKYILEQWLSKSEEKYKFKEQEKNYKNLGYSFEKFLKDNGFYFDLIFNVYDD